MRLTTGSSGALQPGHWDAIWHPPQLQGLQPGLEVQSGDLAMVQGSPLASSRALSFHRWNKFLIGSRSHTPLLSGQENEWF